MSVRLDSVEQAIKDIAAGKAVVVVDDEDRENEGDIIFAAAKATPELMAFTIRHSSGVICVPMPGDMLERLEIPLMTPHNKDKLRTAYTISVDARDGVSTASAPPTGRTPPRCSPTRPPSRGTSPDPATSSRCATATAACSYAVDTPRRPSTGRKWPGSRCPARRSRSSTTTAP